MATVRKSKKKKFIAPICILLVIAIIIGSVFAIKSKSGVETVSLTTISTDNIVETVSATGEVTAGTVREYKAATVATCKEVFVKVGDSVKKDDLLATFDTENVDTQVKSLQATYDNADKSYKQAVASQARAKKQLDVVNKQIKALEKQSAQAKKNASTTTTTKKKTTTTTTTNVYSATQAKVNDATSRTLPSITYTRTDVSNITDVTIPSVTIPTTSEGASTTNAATISDMASAVVELVEVVSQLATDIENTNKLVSIVMTTIATELENGTFDSEVIASAVGEAVSQAISDGIVEVIDSGVAVDMIESAVAQIDWATVGKNIGETEGVQSASLEMQLAALYAERELFTTQSSSTVADAQKQIRDNSKNALDALKKSQEELKAGWVASVDGVVTECNLVPDAQTSALETGLKIENMNKMVVSISLGEYDVHKVKVGMNTSIKTAYGNYTGEVSSIAPTATGGSQGSILDSVGSMAGISGLSSLTSSGAGVKCDITIDKPDENIIPGFDASVEIVTSEEENVPVVPVESIILEKEGKFVYIYNAEEGTATKTQITTGATSDTAYEILDGVSVGDQIISTPKSDYEEDTFKVKVDTNSK